MSVEVSSPEFHYNPALRDLTLFTSTYYGEDEASRLRQELALDLFAHADMAGVRIVVSDGGSNRDFLGQIANHPSVTLVNEPENASMGQSRRFALEVAMEAAAADPDHIFMWLEPEKVNLVDADVLTSLVKPIREQDADVVVPRRLDLSTLPRQQAWIEARANRRITRLMRGQDPDTAVQSDEPDFDLWFGPKVFNRAGAQFFVKYRGQLDKWDAILAPVLDAYRAGLKVGNVPVDFTYPSSQTEHETGNRNFKEKRVEQYGTLMVQLGDPFWRDHELRNGVLQSTSS